MHHTNSFLLFLQGKIDLLDDATCLKMLLTDKTNNNCVHVKDWMISKYLVRFIFYISFCVTMDMSTILLGDSIHMFEPEIIKMIVDELRPRQVILVHPQAENTIDFAGPFNEMKDPVCASPRNPVTPAYEEQLLDFE